ncbi:MAG: hypothetical protein RL204_692 [Bacteroidota bacterium]|jgi:cell division protein FtsI (penicillin-binding protein 3)
MSNQLARDVSKKAYGIAMMLGIVALAIFGKVIWLQAFPDPDAMLLGESKAFRAAEITPSRGQILSSDGSLLATSVPDYEIRWDSEAKYDQDEYRAKIDSLAQAFSKLLGDKTPGEYKKLFANARATHDRYKKITDHVDYNQLQKIKTFPLIRKGRMKSGFVFIEKSKRKKPFGALAARTIGLNREDNQVGLELAYDEILAGKKGRQLQEKMAGGEWRPMNDEFQVEPTPGMDIVATIDVHLQDVADAALRRQLTEHGASWGCAILMEVQTGYIRAIANLSLNPATGVYDENLNLAIAQGIEPGSTFKLASLMACLDEDLISLSDSVETGNGSIFFYGKEMTDSNKENGGHGTLSAEEVFEKSSNIGTALLVKKSFEKNPQKFLDKLNSFGLGKPMDLELSGEFKPKLYTSTKAKGWSGLSLTNMAIGYETQFSPLQILTLYNAVANNGTLVRPLFVQEIRQNGRVVEKKNPVVLNQSICKKETLKECRKMMEGVMEKGGTAESVFKNSPYHVAGKTGTAWVNDGAGYEEHKYRGSFVGYFPAENPRYSCIVVVHNPTSGAYYGGAVAAPVFKELADKIYSTQLDFHGTQTPVDSLMLANKMMPVSKSGSTKELFTVFKTLNIATIEESNGDYVNTATGKENVTLSNRTITPGTVPNVVGMGLQDALFLLESEGIKVQILGVGTVKRQSVAPGASSKSNKYITIELS